MMQNEDNPNARTQRQLANWLLALLILNLVFNRTNSLNYMRKIEPNIKEEQHRENQIKQLGEIMNSTISQHNYPNILNALYFGKYNHSHTRAMSLSTVNVVLSARDSAHLIDHESHNVGEITIQLYNEKSPVSKIDLVGATISLADTENQRLTTIYMIGYYFVPLGRLVLFSNLPKSEVLVKYNTTSIDSQNLTVEYINLFKGLPRRNGNAFCTSELVMDINASSSDPLINQGYLHSSNCDIHIAFNTSGHTFEFPVLYYHANLYAMFFIAVSCFEIYATSQQLQRTDTTAKMEKVSFYTTAILGATDCYYSILHFVCGSQVTEIITFFLLLAFLKFILFSFFDLRFMLHTWKAQLPADSTIDLRQGILSLYLKFYLFLCIGFFFANVLIVPIIYVVVLSSPFVSQIYRSAMHNYRREIISDVFLFAVSLSRLVLPYYFGLYSQSVRVIVFGQTYYYSFGILIPIWVILQVLLVKGQAIYGPRFFIPAAFLPPTYNYHRQIPQQLFDLESGQRVVTDCVICMSDVSIEEPYLITPCNHIFHTNCLQEWMNVKMDCPTCRRHLPDFD